ncbi:beta-N-acetylhexosaminidase [Vibrio natriegens]|uniref:beta-N-acetylhexosaminidase n=1 Tax=Vibrio natriegens TaxID=691 RepID=UPI00390A6D98
MNVNISAVATAISLSLLAGNAYSSEQNQQKTEVIQSVVDTVASSLEVHIASIEHQPADTKAKCPGGYCYRAEITLTNKGKKEIVGDWEIYFSNLRRILDTKSDLFEITHVNGDLHRIVPTSKFKGLKPGDSVAIQFDAEHWKIVDSDYMPRYYVAAQGAEARVIPNTIPQEGDGLADLSGYLDLISTAPEDANMWQRYPEDSSIMATAGTRYERNLAVKDLGLSSVSAKIIPSPIDIKVHNSSVDISSGLNLKIEEDSLTADQLDALEHRFNQLGVTPNKGIPVVISVDPKHKAFKGKTKQEAYTLKVTPKEVRVVGADPAGAFYGVQSLAALVTVGSQTIPEVTIDYDAPRFEHRGMHLDVARNFKSKAEIKKVLDQMAAYKMNKFHFHLADDEGWRLEIPGLPELTEVGAQRCHDLSERQCLLPQVGSGPDDTTSGSGYYSVDDYAEILAFASARNIQVIPSMDMPGHARAAVKSMEARYHKYAELGDMAAAEMYLLTDRHDGSEYFSVQNYTDNTINPCMESSFVFMDKVISEIAKQHKNAGQPLVDYHIGADETHGAWVDSPVCRALFVDPTNNIDNVADLGGYFIERISHILEAKQLNLAAWNDGLKHGSYMDPTKLAGDASAYTWSALFWGGANEAHSLANAGYNVILSLPEVTYFDHPYEADPREPGNYWAGRYTDTQKVFNFMPENLPANAETMTDRDNNPFEIPASTVALQDGKRFKGMQGHVWTEMVRTDEQLDHRVFPRILGIAERAWSKADWELEYDAEKAYRTNTSGYKGTDHMGKRIVNRDDDWTEFANTLGYKEFAKLDAAGVAYRLPVPGAKIDNNGKLSINNAFPGVTVQYSVNGTNWQNYDHSNKPTVKAGVKIRSIASTGRAGREIVVN